ncbi:MAG: hypothetical protein RI885_588 [Actinomycetota bacterium]
MAASTRARRLRKRIALTAIGALILGLTAFLVWCSILYPAEAAPLASVTDDAAIVTTQTPEAFVLEPAGGATEVGLVFIPGAKVPAEAYAAKLAGIVDAGVTVVITKPILNLAFFDPRPLSTFTDLAPSVGRWYVGGHSLGGVRACQFAAGTEGLVLFGSYCAADLPDDIAVLSISASEDGLSTPADIEANAGTLPDDAEFVEIEGGTHAQFGDYGLQPGDGTATIDDADVAAQITAALEGFLR